MVINKDL